MSNERNITYRITLIYSHEWTHFNSKLNHRCTLQHKDNGQPHMTRVVVVAVVVAAAVVVVGEVSLVCDRADMFLMLLRHVAEAITIPN